MTPRRMMFQLVSLFDLLMIIIFAQYLDVRERAQSRIGEAEAQARLAQQKASAAERAALDRVRVLERQFRDQAAADQRSTELQRNLDDTRAQLQSLSDLLSKIFSLPDERLEQLFRAESPADMARLKELLKKLAESQGTSIVRHALAVSELEKRCDLWELHIQDNNEFELRAGDQVRRFRADSSDSFQSALFRSYRSFSQPKRLVIILCTWGWNTSIRTRQAAYDGLPGAIERMTDDNDRRTRFEFAWLGPLGQR